MRAPLAFLNRADIPLIMQFPRVVAALVKRALFIYFIYYVATCNKPQQDVSRTLRSRFLQHRVDAKHTVLHKAGHHTVCFFLRFLSGYT